MEIPAEMSLVMARVPLWPPYTTQHKEQGPQQHPESQRWDWQLCDTRNRRAEWSKSTLCSLLQSHAEPSFKVGHRGRQEGKKHMHLL